MVLAAFFMQPHPPAFSLLVIILDIHADDGRHAREAVNHHGEQGAIAQAAEFGHVDGIQQQSGFLRVRTGVLPFLMTYLGPRTAEAGFTASTPPVTIQSNSIRIAARCCLTVGFDNPSFRSSLHRRRRQSARSCRGPCRLHRRTRPESVYVPAVGIAGVLVADVGGEDFDEAPGRVHADIVCLLARCPAGILEGRIYLSQLSESWGPPHRSSAEMLR